ncbi:hypothetical protein DS838_002200 [Geotrichum bryndzae]|nr:hypothetical protein DV454_004320 [Geotrichum candidum]KAI9212938.1 hypothetical protein DS838_002200 [Geotrichum bryndzae]
MKLQSLILSVCVGAALAQSSSEAETATSSVSRSGSATSSISRSGSATASASRSGSATSAASRTTSSSSSSSFDVQSYYSSLDYNVVSFYDDFVRNKKNYEKDYKRFFISHSFEAAGTWGSVLPQMTTYTDDSFTTELSATPELVTVLASVATEFPWYSDWVNKHPYDKAVSTSSTSGAAEAGLVQVSRQSMKLAFSVFMALFVLFFMSFIGF